MMSGWSKETILKRINTDLLEISNQASEVKKNVDDIHKEFSDYLSTLLEQIPGALSGPLIPKTPKVPRKRVKRIETIPEDDVAENESKVSDTLVEVTGMEDQEDEDGVAPRASRRAASLKASTNIKKQQGARLNSKIRRPSTGVDEEATQKPVRASRAKRTISVAASSDEEEAKRPAKKHSRSTRGAEKNDTTIVVVKTESNTTYTAVKDEAIGRSSRSSRSKRPREESVELGLRGSSKNVREPAAKKANIVNETMNIPEADLTVEPSMYEDAVGKSIPMNSTMNPNSTVTFDKKMMNVTVVLESMHMPMRINETVTMKKSSSSARSSGRDTLVNEEPPAKKAYQRSPLVAKSVLQSKTDLQDRMKALKETMANKEFSALITDDDSSPERKTERKAKRVDKPEVKTKQRITRSSLLSEDDAVAPTPTKTVLRDINGMKTGKNPYKTNTLFSPYTTDSVKKRVEAFEQAQMNSPKSVDVDAPTRVTRTKTRAMAAAAADADQQEKSIVQKSIVQKASRKSLAKAMKIALMKEMREVEERKENNTVNSAQKPTRLLATNDKLIQKQQQRTTPVGKSRLQMPMSVNRIHHTPAGIQIVNHNKAQTVSRSNIITSVDSFLPAKTLSKAPSTDNLTEKKRKVNDEDARRKRDEALKAKTEEKKRKREEKELRNKLAREANEKLDMEKRLKVEKEREEKAKAAQWLQEKQREEAERKRLIQLQRAQEKEERRRQEEQLRLQRLQEQEEAERQLAEQKRREQEAERRRQAEARAQHLAASEAARMKAHMIAKAKLANMKNAQGPTSYEIDSEPDDDDSEDETKPKKPVPYWALASVRKTQVKINSFVPVPVVYSFFGARRCTPDLTELFKGIKKERLQRTSSAIWKTPPRYSMMMNGRGE